MARYRFPQERHTFLYSGPGEPIRQAGQVSVRVYVDKQMTTLAQITDLDDDPIAGSVLWIEPNGMLPEFRAADGVVVLWAKTTEDDSPYRLEAVYEERIVSTGMTGMNLGIDTDGIPYLIVDETP